MPICFKPESLHGKEDARGKDQAESSAPDWREPPGYLGEAVRRAKRISENAKPSRLAITPKTERLPRLPPCATAKGA